MKILIAEDEPVSRLLLQRTLLRLGHEVVEAADGRAAWAAFQKEGIPLLISDWMMPDIDGPELCRRIRREGRSKYTYIILLTTLSGKRRYLDGLEAGADDFMTKPFDAEELAARLRVAERILSLQATVRQLEGLLPICAYCKRIWDASNVWTPIEQYVSRRTDAAFSHGICPSCFEKEIAHLDGRSDAAR